MTQNGGPESAGQAPAAIRASVMMPIVFCASLVPWASETSRGGADLAVRKPFVTVPCVGRAR